MQYFGGKQRISKRLAVFINTTMKKDQPFVDAFCGSCNVISKVDSNRLRIANDKHKYLMQMWKDYNEGKEYPSKITKQDYDYIKSNKDHDPALTGLVGFGMSFGGKWFGGFTGEVSKNGQDYLKCAVNGLNKKMKTMNGVVFKCGDYWEIDLPDNSFIYCDIPYKGTTTYCKKEVGEFNHEDFYKWCREKVKEGHDVYVSEYDYNVPQGAEVVWSVQSGTTNAAWQGSAKKTVEVLYRFAE